MALAQFTNNTDSDFFKPADYSATVALLFSPKEVRVEKNPFDDGDRKVAYAQLAVFNDYDALDNLNPVDLGRVAVTNGVLAESLEPYIGEDVAVTVAKHKGKKNTYWAFSQLDPDVYKKVGEYVEKRDAGEIVASDDDDSDIDDLLG